MTQLRDALLPWLEGLERSAAENKPPLVTGVRDVDSLLGVLPSGSVVLVAGRRGAGKTALLVKASRAWALRGAGPVALVSAQLSADEMLCRLASAEGCVNTVRARNGHMDEPEWGRLSGAVGRLDASEALEIIDIPLLGYGLFAGQRRGDEAPKGGLIAIDGLELCRNGEREGFLRQVRSYARDTGAVALVSMLLPSGGGYGRPVYSEIDFDVSKFADVSIGLYRDELYNSGAEGEIEIIIMQNRHGSVGTVSAAFAAPFGEIVDLALVPGGKA